MRQASQQNPGNGYKISEQKVKFDAIVEFALSGFGHYCYGCYLTSATH